MVSGICDFFFKTDARRWSTVKLSKNVNNKKNVNELELISLHIIDIISAVKWFQLLKRLLQ